MTRAAGKTQRADAARNRERLLTAAVRAFTRDGLDATVKSIADDAGVGVGTLYRHFPTRDALIEAAYRNELDRLCDAADTLLTTEPPAQAVRTWMGRFIDYTTAKYGMAEALRAITAAGANPYAHSRDRLIDSLTTLLTAAAKANTIRQDTTPEDLLTALSGVAMAVGTGDQSRRTQADRVLDLLADGLRP
ncbi:TetR/AcrR family transcriptional regulator [Umezawaea sp. NPDC059074]|uniref:TetR/AcrR family transcriptional regulator n=1 Tax=Umezawaea sp. NPDC059074 TaxID=3346716 RepID=UPI0036BE2565